MVKLMGLETIYIKMVKFKLVIGLMIFFLELDMNFLIMNIIQENFFKEKKQVLGLLEEKIKIKIISYMKEKREIINIMDQE